jgi:hypothetical protein
MTLPPFFFCKPLRAVHVTVTCNGYRAPSCPSREPGDDENPRGATQGNFIFKIFRRIARSPTMVRPVTPPGPRVLHPAAPVTSLGDRWWPATVICPVIRLYVHVAARSRAEDNFAWPTTHEVPG